MKVMPVLLLTSFFTYSALFAAPESSILTKKLLQEYFVIAHILKQAPPAKRQKITLQAERLIAHAQAPEQLYADITLFRQSLQQKNTAIPNRTIFDAATTTAYYPPQMHSPFDSVWHALTYCGFFCILYLIFIAVKDNDARKILHEKKPLEELAKRHNCIKNAAATTIAISNAVLSESKGG
ncbi:MAG: hypothetical protein QG632_727 [Candidatus Dependentiae bacterium]|nr:hypothetical protein [Candidatus Dependentiae bacterium]